MMFRSYFFPVHSRPHTITPDWHPHSRFSLIVWRMSRLTRNWTVKPVSRDEILRRERGQGNIIFPCSAIHEQDSIDFTHSAYLYLIHTLLKVLTIHIIHTTYTHIHTKHTHFPFVAFDQRFS